MTLQIFHHGHCLVLALVFCTLFSGKYRRTRLNYYYYYYSCLCILIIRETRMGDIVGGRREKVGWSRTTEYRIR